MERIVRFESTIWTLIKKARAGDTTGAKELFTKYKEPVMNFIINSGFSEHDADDIAQEIFLRVFHGNLLEKAERSRARFRSFLLKLTRSMINLEKRKRSAQKRGGAIKHLSIDEPFQDDAIIKDVIAMPEKDEGFDKIWMHNLLKIAFKRLKEESKQRGTPYYQALKLYLEIVSYEKIARSLGKNVHDVKNYIHRAKAKIMDYIKDEIAEYSSSKSEYMDEINYLSKYLEIT
jgi:RNA polymerase sigma-70 factor (ECF subfamily)